MGTHTHSVAELTALISDALSSAFSGEVWVQGEVHNYRTSPAGHAYFNLVEPGTLGRPNEATMSVVLFRGNRRAVDHVLAKVGGMELADDLQVRIRGELLYYAPQGRVQIRMTAVDPAHTLGRLSVDRDRLLRVLHSEGLLERNRRLELSPVPLRVGLITSDASAAAHDALDELSKSGLGWQVQLVDSRVQGADAVTQLVAALRTTARLDLDVVALVRGGGPRTDLVAFDHESVARAIAHMPVPVITGIGHEIDETVADRVAYRSFKTPTACAAFLCQTVTAYRNRCDELWRSLAARGLGLLDRHDDMVRSTAGRVASGARRSLELNAARLIEHRAAIGREPMRALERSERNVESLSRHVHALDPVRVIARGWSITRTADGELVRQVADVTTGVRLVTRVADGSITSIVETADPDSPRPPTTPATTEPPPDA